MWPRPYIAGGIPYTMYAHIWDGQGNTALTPLPSPFWQRIPVQFLPKLHSSVCLLEKVERHTWARGVVRRGDAHRLTPQNTVPLPMAKFDPPNREKMKLSKATPSLFPQKQKKNGEILNPFCFFKDFFPKPIVAEENFAFYPLPTHTLIL